MLDERVEEGVKRLDVCFQQLQRRVRSVFRVLRALVSVTEFSLVSLLLKALVSVTKAS